MGRLSLLLIAVAVVSPLAGWAMRRFVQGQEGAHTLSWSVALPANASIAVFAAVVMPPNYLLPATLLLGWVLLALSIVDFLELRLPDVLTLPLTAAGLTLSLFLPEGQPLTHLIGAAAGFSSLYGVAIMYRRFRGREGLGLGDAKLAAAAGAWLGWQPLPFVVLIACSAGFVWIAVGVMLRGREALRQEIAFGVPLCVAFWLVWLYGVPDFVLSASQSR
jgi:leader peptidase (prepilin peptidase)/N-methyltransferase